LGAIIRLFINLQRAEFLDPKIQSIVPRAQSVENVSRLSNVIQKVYCALICLKLLGVIRIYSDFSAIVCLFLFGAVELCECVRFFPIPAVAMNADFVLLISLALISLIPVGISATCESNEICISKKRCDETDDSGRGILVKRVLEKSCGRGLVCCDKVQVENYDAYEAEIEYRNQRRGNPWGSSESPLEAAAKEEPTVAKKEEEGYKSCGVKRECVPRHLCTTGVVNEDGRYIIKPRINDDSNFGCRSVEQCCPLDDRVRGYIGYRKTQNPYLGIPELNSYN